MKVTIETLGCKVNQYESQAMEQLLLERGHELAASVEESDAVIINTCAVTAESGRKSRQAVRHLMKQCPGAVIAVCGCYSQLSPEDAAALGVTLVGGSGDRLGFLDRLEQACTDRAQQVSVDNALSRRDFEELPAGRLSGRTRALLKIQDGCVNFCSYCIIPYTRGPVRSLPPERIAACAAELCAAGYKEMVITGIEIASYGRDLKNGIGLIDAIETASAAAPGMRVRIGSLEPRVITDEFCRRLRAIPGLCEHFHLSLQSGCDRTLQAMRRRYSTTDFLAVCERLRETFPDCGITTDVICGFPGETAEDHAETLRFIEKCAFSDMHIFPYSRRPGTRADQLPGQLTTAVKRERTREAIAVARRMTEEYYAGCVGKTLAVLFEQTEDGTSRGHAGNYCEVRVPGEGLRNRVLPVRITGWDAAGLIGCIEPTDIA